VSEATRRSWQTREHVLDAAERLFAARGYDGASMEEIGREAGLSRGTPGYFFRSKQNLYDAVLDRLLERGARALAPAYARARAGDGGVAELVAGLVEAHVRLLVDDPALARLIQWESLDDDARIVGVLHSRVGTLTGLIQGLRARLGRPPLPEADAIALIVDAVGLCWFPLAHADALEAAFGWSVRDDGAVRRQTAELVQLVLARLERA
jgi:AcrR family transcriptional regulator